MGIESRLVAKNVVTFITFLFFTIGNMGLKTLLAHVNHCSQRQKMKLSRTFCRSVAHVYGYSYGNWKWQQQPPWQKGDKGKKGRRKGKSPQASYISEFQRHVYSDSFDKTIVRRIAAWFPMTDTRHIPSNSRTPFYPGFPGVNPGRCAGWGI